MVPGHAQGRPDPGRNEGTGQDGLLQRDVSEPIEWRSFVKPGLSGAARDLS
jgi:hypothetical protein